MSNSKETNTSTFKEATKNLLHAGKTWVDAALQTGSDQYTKRIEPRIESFKDRINREVVKNRIRSQKKADVKQDTSRRKYHKGS